MARLHEKLVNLFKEILLTSRQNLEHDFEHDFIKYTAQTPSVCVLKGRKVGLITRRSLVRV